MPPLLRPLAFALFALSMVSCSSGPDATEHEAVLSVASSPGGGAVVIHRYENNADDASGNGLHGTIYGDPMFRSSCLDRAIVVDGQNDFVHIPAHYLLEPMVVSLEVYFRPKEVLKDNAGFLPIVVKMPPNGNFWNTVDGYDLWYQDSGGGGRIGFGIGDNGGTLRYHASWWGTMTPNKYYHIVGTYDGYELRLYMDGELVDVTPHSGPIAYRGGPIWVGGHIRHSFYGSGYHDFEGAIDEVTVYDYVLSPEEVWERSKRCPRVDTSNEDDPRDRHDEAATP